MSLSLFFLESIYFHYEQPVYPRDCEEVFDQCSASNISGVYLIKPDGYYEPFAIYCESDTHTGRWTVSFTFVLKGPLAIT